MKSMGAHLDVFASMWVGASAGTGKTKILTDRVLALLLSGVAFEKILCLTFTKAAASEMVDRIRRRLSLWSMMAEVDLEKELKALLLRPATSQEKKIAKGLFQQLMESAKGFSIQTIHGFCQSLLKRFPLEANLPPYFQTIDEVESSFLKEKSFLKAIEKVEEEVLEHVLKFTSPLGLEQLVKELSENHHVRNFLRSSSQELFKRTHEIFPSHEEEGMEDIYEHLEKLISSTNLTAFQPKTKLDETLFYFFKKFPNSQVAQEKKGLLKAFFLTKGETPRARLVSKNGQNFFPTLAEELSLIQERYISALEGEAQREVISLSKSLLKLLYAFLESYEKVKNKEALLDYDDLILHAKTLLSAREYSAWVLYKLDGGVSHILLDEAQDTSTPQWEIVRALVDEFFSGDAARESVRTLFVVGDEKQSIYGFQGATPQLFQEMRDHFKEKVEAAQHRWLDIELSTSYRSAPEILEVVHKTFSFLPEKSFFKERVQPFRDVKGYIELWPKVQEEKINEDATESIKKFHFHPRDQLAFKVAKKIRAWLDEGRILPSKQRPICPKDIMILVRRRDSLVSALVKYLKYFNVPVTGLDRLLLGEELCIKDLLSLARFLVLPEDDFELAVVLKGPLFGFSDEDLLFLRENPEKTLWHALCEKARASAKFEEAISFLKDSLSKVDFVTLSELFFDVLYLKGGLQRFISRLGKEVEDPLREFLDICLDYESRYGPNLLEFINYMEENSLEVKRNLEGDVNNEVRVMTVHGSKGLQSPVVMLPDTVHPPKDTGPIHIDLQQQYLAWIPSSIPFSQKLKERLLPKGGQEEYLRLLYVAMTRAEDELYVGGWEKTSPGPTQSWYEIIEDAMKDCAVKVPDREGRFIYQYGEGVSFPESRTVLGSERANICSKELPAWVNTHLEEEEQRVINPSRTGDTESSENMGGSRKLSMERGTFLHKILEYIYPLNSLPETLFERLCILFNIPEVLKSDIFRSVSNLLKNEEIKTFLSRKGFSETSVVSSTKIEKILGQVDRLYIDSEQKVIDIVDFKSGKRGAKGSEKYIKQMAHYKNILSSIYPGYQIRIFLLWIDEVFLEELII